MKNENTINSGMRGTEKIMLGMAFLTFVSLGMHEGSLGVAWPSIRHDFGLPLDYLGMLLIASTCGVLVSSFNSGWLLSRIEFGVLLVIANLLRAAGMLGYVFLPEWWMVVASAVLVGLGAGTIDSGMNTFVAARYGSGPLNWLHACYGLGAMISPLIITRLLANGLDWRWGFIIIAVLQIILAFYFALNLKHWPSRLLLNDAQNNAQERAPSSLTLGMFIVWLGIAVFFFCVGVELSVGQWSFTLFTEGRAVSVNRAGLWVSIFWGSLTFGRILFGFITERIGPTRLLRLGMGGMILGTLLLWWNPTNLVGFFGLALIGFSVAPIFPVMIGLSPARFGQQHAANAIGFQVAAAYLGGALIPALVGVAAYALGLEVIGLLMLVFSILTFAIHEVLVRKCGL
ncbi:sugar MFS transporter [Chloroflexota bacterium]